jgi:hypothetical protein
VRAKASCRLYFSYRDARQAVSDVERERAATVAAAIDQLVSGEPLDESRHVRAGR